MIDLLIQIQGSGGELLKRNGDLVGVYGFENQSVLAMFGGNAWFGNDLFLPGNTAAQFNAKTEEVLRVTPLTSGNLKIIEDAINADLAFLEAIPGTTYSVATAILAKNKLQIAITINGATFYFNWNPDESFLNYQV